MSQGGAFLVEVVLTSVFVLRVLFATHKAAIQGAAVSLSAWPGGGPPHRDPPDRHLGQPGPEPRAGPGSGGHGVGQVWVFLVAPLVGGILAAVVHLAVADRSKDVTVSVSRLSAGSGQPAATVASWN